MIDKLIDYIQEQGFSVRAYKLDDTLTILRISLSTGEEDAVFSWSITDLALGCYSDDIFFERADYFMDELRHTVQRRLTQKSLNSIAFHSSSHS